MMPHRPDTWVIIEFNHPGEETFHKVLAGWSGGYLQGDSWRMNSGITKMESEGDYYYFYGMTGSVYECHKNSETMRMMQYDIYNQMKEYDKENGGDIIKRVSVKDIEPLYMK